MKFNDRHIEAEKQQVEEKLKPVLDTIAKEIIKKEKSEMNVHERKLEEEKSFNVYKKTKEEEQQLVGEQAARYSVGKIRYDLIPSYPIDELAKVYTYGTTKYNSDNWRKGLKWRKDVVGPVFRHLWKWIKGEKIDEESGCHHLAMVLWNICTLIEYERCGVGIDDRNPFDLTLMDSQEVEKRIKKWKQLAKENKYDDYNGLDV